MLLLTAVMCMAEPQALLAQDERVTVRPEDTGAALENPGMGWVLHFYDNVPANYGSRLDPSDTVDDFPGLTVVYLRIPWSYIEPEEGKFNWAVVDTPGQRWIAKGKQVALRFSCCESWMRWATPEWVEKAGAKGHNFTPGKLDENGPFWEPDYDDPVFLEKLDHFLAAAAARYDGNPEVAFIDVGSFGVWGEGHLWSSTQLKYPASTVIKHIDLHVKHFRHTLLAANDDFSFQGDEAIAYARDHGLTLRDDSILVQGGQNAYFHAAMAQDFWPRLPVILESEHYGGSRDRGNWQDGSKYLQAVEEYHASYASIHWWPREFLAEQRALIDRINLRLGHRLQLVEASWPKTVRHGGSFRLTTQWRNAGVAPCYGGGYPALTLKDAKGGIAGVFVDEGSDVRTLPVSPRGQAEARQQEAEFALPFNVATGAYDAFISVGTRTGTPKIALPLADGDGQRRYRIGTLSVTGDYAVQAGAPMRRGEGWVLPLTWTVHLPLPAGVSPFCHFEQEGRIVFQGAPDATPPRSDLEKPGTVALPVAFGVPPEVRGKQFEVKVGLWVPERIGRPDERLIPDGGTMDRRVTLGRLEVSEAGDVRLTTAQP
jgi:Domain of unknown function (DUF4832)